MQPEFSAQRIAGRSGFDLAKKGEIFDQKLNKIEIFSIIVNKIDTISLENLEKNSFDKVNAVCGDFRQTKILNKWKKVFKKLREKHINKLPVITLTAEVSSKTYIRALVRDISQKMGVPATTYSITRTRNGDFTSSDII